MKNTGTKVKSPSKKCNDKKCPFHGKISLRGSIFKGTVTKTTTRTAKVEFQRLFPLPKYERFEKRRTRIQAHNPPCINAQVGDEVKIMECRPIAKTKNFIIIEK